MKKALLLFAQFLVLHFIMQAQRIYSIPVNDIDGNLIRMGELAMKKTVFIVLPVNSNDSINVEVVRFVEQFGDSINIIGVLSKEAGFDDASKSSVGNLFSGRRIVLTETMHVHKAAGAKQSLLLQWLTDKSKNRLSDKEANPGAKFFVSETGRLFAVFSRETSLHSPIISRIINTPRIN